MISIRYEQVAANLDRARKLAANCEALYREAPNHLRRQFNQLFVKTLLVDDDGEIAGAELTDESPPFSLEISLSASNAKQLATRCLTARNLCPTPPHFAVMVLLRGF